MFLGIYYPKFTHILPRSQKTGMFAVSLPVWSREHDSNMIPPTWQHPHFGFFLSGGVCGPSVSCLQRIFCGATITVLPRSSTVTHRRMSGREKPTVRGWPGLSHQLESHLIPPGGQDLVATWLHLLLIWEQRPWCGLADCHDGGSRSLKLTPWSRLPQQRRLLLPPLHWTLQHFLHFSPAACCQVWIKQLGRCDRETIELANNTNDSIVRTAGKASK